MEERALTDRDKPENESGDNAQSQDDHRPSGSGNPESKPVLPQKPQFEVFRWYRREDADKTQEGDDKGGGGA